MYDPQAKKLNEQGTFKEIVVEISARQLSAKSETLRQMSTVSYTHLTLPTTSRV